MKEIIENGVNRSSTKNEKTNGNIAKQSDAKAIIKSANPNLRLSSGVAGASGYAPSAFKDTALIFLTGIDWTRYLEFIKISRWACSAAAQKA